MRHLHISYLDMSRVNSSIDTQLNQYNTVGCRDRARQLMMTFALALWSGFFTMGCDALGEFSEESAESSEAQRSAAGLSDVETLRLTDAQEETRGEEDEGDESRCGEWDEEGDEEWDEERAEEGDEEWTEERDEARGQLLAIGDSVLDWNRDEGASIPAVVGRHAQLEVVNAAISGSQMLDESDEGIPQQYQSGPWSWVLIDGGANDVGDGCGCGACMGQVDQIISADSSEGVMASLVSRAVNGGAQVILLGYYRVSGEEFVGCEDEAEALNTRYRALADRSSEVIFVDMGDAVEHEPMSVYLDEDGIHPSVYGGSLIGELIARRIME